MFNKKGRIQNTVMTSTAGIIGQLVSIILSFAYRTVLLMILDKSYLGLNGLFSNILSVLSLAELGIGSAIAYRLYSSVKNDDIFKTAALMDFYRKVYRVIALVITIAGLAIMPALKFFIKDMSEVPADINIYLIYFLFLIQTISSYLFVYKQSVMSADQRGYIINYYNTALTIVKSCAQMLVLFLTKSFTFTLISGIVIQIVCNFLLSLYVTNKYKEVFEIREKLSKEEKKAIYKETGALLCHKIGGTVSLSIDSILLSALIGVGVLGMYSNYTIIVQAVAMLIGQLLYACTSSIGNLHFSNNVEYEKKTFFRMLFLNLWIAGFCALSLFVLLNPFIDVWLGKEMLFDEPVVLVICISFFMSNAKIVNGTFITACGLFVKDKIRPLIEAFINLTTSILFVKYLGIIGIFIGTTLGIFLTVWWREPYLLFKHEFKSSSMKYWCYYFVGVVIMVFAGFATYYACKFLPLSFGYLILRFLICAILPNLIFLLLTFKVPEFSYFAQLFKRIICKLFRINVKKEINGGKNED